MTNDIVFSYEPREQFIPFHQRNQRFACGVAHRRAGKTVACVNELLERASYTEKKSARYAYIAPYYRQAKEIAWQYLKEYGRDAIVKTREAELSVELFNGAKIALYGADNPDALRGVYFDGAVLDEFGDCRPSLWGQVVLPTLADRNGWAVFIGTPKGRNHFYKVYQRSLVEPNWFNFTLKASKTKILDEFTLGEMKAQMTEDEYEQEFECSFDAAVMGTYYAKSIAMLEERGQITKDTLYDKEFPVHVACDLGYTDSTAFWFWQDRPDGLAIIDYYENHSQPLEHYFNHLSFTGYKFERIWLPHDARAKTLQTGRSTAEQFRDAGFPITIAPNLKVQQGIDAARLVMNHCWFDEEKCSDGIEALRAYRRAYDEDKKSFSNRPLHDWSSHGADAFRYLALVAKERIVRANSEEINLPSVMGPKTPYKLRELFDERENRVGSGYGRSRI